LKINKKKDDKIYPLLNAVLKNNTEMVKLIIDYANKNEIILEISEDDIENIISENFKYNINSISDINMKIIEVLYRSRKNNKLRVIFSYSKSELYKRINEILEKEKGNIVY